MSEPKPQDSKQSVVVSVYLSPELRERYLTLKDLGYIDNSLSALAAQVINDEAAKLVEWMNSRKLASK